MSDTAHDPIGHIRKSGGDGDRRFRVTAMYKTTAGRPVATLCGSEPTPWDTSRKSATIIVENYTAIDARHFKFGHPVERICADCRAILAAKPIRKRKAA